MSGSPSGTAGAAYSLGIDLGTTFTAAAVRRDGHLEIAHLGDRAAAVPSVLYAGEDGGWLYGDPANRRAVAAPERVAREFKRRLGDPAPIILGGSPYSADALVAKLLAWVVSTVSAQQGGPPAEITLSYPATWGPYKQDLLRQAADRAGLGVVTLRSEPEAAALSYASAARVEPGTTIAVYDLGGGTFDATLLRKTRDGFELLGQPQGIERLGGIDFDEAVFEHVRKELGGVLDAAEPADRETTAAVARLRAECVAAKEALSSDTEATITVTAPGRHQSVRLVRAEFEDMIRPAVTDTVETLRRAVGSADLEPADVDTVLLVGGSARIPLVAQLVSTGLGRPIASDVHPTHATAMGAALGPDLDSEPETPPTGTPTPVAGAAAAGVVGAAAVGAAAVGAAPAAGVAPAAAKGPQAAPGGPPPGWPPPGGAPPPPGVGPRPMPQPGRLAGPNQSPPFGKPQKAGWSRPAIVLTVVVALLIVGGGAAAAFLFLGGGRAGAEVVTEPIGTPGANPFMPSVGTDTPNVTPPPNTAGSFPGNTPGLYGGTLNASTCDPAAMVAFLQANPDKAAAWAGVLGITVGDIPGYVAQLTPVLLRSDTYVTNHGYANGKATTLISVLQAGTAVLVDKYGTPRVKCYCGNPLTPAAAVAEPRFVGPTWTGFGGDNITVIQEITVIIETFTLVNPFTSEVFERPAGTTGAADRPTGVSLPSTGPPPPTAVGPTVGPTVAPPPPAQARTSSGGHVLTQRDGGPCDFSDAPRITGSITMTVQPNGAVSGSMKGSGKGTRTGLTCGGITFDLNWSQNYTANFSGQVSGGRLTASGTLSNTNGTTISNCKQDGQPSNCPNFETGGSGNLPISLTGSYDQATGAGEGSFTVQVGRTTTGTWNVS